MFSHLSFSIHAAPWTIDVIYWLESTGDILGSQSSTLPAGVLCCNNAEHVLISLSNEQTQQTAQFCSSFFTHGGFRRVRTTKLWIRLL